MYYKTILTPQVADTNMTRHIDHTVYIDWFDRARTSMYREMDPTVRFHPHGLVVVTTSVSYLRETNALSDVEIRTWVAKLGVKSVEIRQDLWQHSQSCAKSQTVMCGFNLHERKSEPLVAPYRQICEKYAWDEPIL